MIKFQRNAWSGFDVLLSSCLNFHWLRQLIKITSYSNNFIWCGRSLVIIPVGMRLSGAECYISAGNGYTLLTVHTSFFVSQTKVTMVNILLISLCCLTRSHHSLNSVRIVAVEKYFASITCCFPSAWHLYYTLPVTGVSSHMQPHYIVCTRWNEFSHI